MRRLIDANALKIAFKCREMADIDLYGGVHIAECFQGYEANEIVDKMPTVDAVEVVRCKDCDYCEEAFDDYWCNYNWNYAPKGKPKLTRADGFCHNGERKDNE